MTLAIVLVAIVTAGWLGGLYLILNFVDRTLTDASAHITQLMDRIQAPETAVASAQVRMSEPRTPPKPPTHRILRGRAGVGAVKVPIRSEGDEEMGG